LKSPKQILKSFLIKTRLINILYKFRHNRHRLSIFWLAFKYYFYNNFLTNFPSYKIRTGYLRRALKIQVGHETSIHMGCFFTGNNIKIGSNTVIARNCYFDGRSGLIDIKNNVSIAPEAYILTMSHSVHSPTFDAVVKPVTIEDYVWIGAKVMILPGVTAGEGCVLAAASVVTKSVEPYAIVAGSPAKVIGERTKGLNYKLVYFPFFNTDIC
jgi:acetyltransferase-like isoleucine patch superfamily enzyme